MRVLCGTDIIHIDRIEKAVDRQGIRFLERIYTAREIALCTSQGKLRMASLAARFAGKEALAKALGTGIGPHHINWTDLEILTAPSGAPTVNLLAGASQRYLELGGISIAVSLTHDQNIAQAFCVLLSASDEVGHALQDPQVLPLVKDVP